MQGALNSKTALHRRSCFYQPIQQHSYLVETFANPNVTGYFAARLCCGRIVALNSSHSINWDLTRSRRQPAKAWYSEKCEKDSGSDRPTEQPTGGSVIKETQGSRKEIQRVRIRGAATKVSAEGSGNNLRRISIAREYGGNRLQCPLHDYGHQLLEVGSCNHSQFADEHRPKVPSLRVTVRPMRSPRQNYFLEVDHFRPRT
jgi:hypothetical protein